MLMSILSVVVVPLLPQHILQVSSVGPAGSPELIGDPKLARSAFSGQILFQFHSDDGLSLPAPTLHPSSPWTLLTSTSAPPSLFLLSLQLVVKEHRHRHHVWVSFLFSPVLLEQEEKGGWRWKKDWDGESKKERRMVKRGIKMILDGGKTMEEDETENSQ